MKEVILLLTVLVMFIVCFFVMGKIGYFINENYKAFIIEERENTQSCKRTLVSLTFGILSIKHSPSRSAAA